MAETTPAVASNDDEGDTVRKIHAWSQALGLDPSFSLSIAVPESELKHIAASDSKSTSFGPFQVNKATAEANNIDYNDMVKNKDLAIWAGLKNLARHAANPDLEGNPSRIIAAHRFGEGSPYAKSGKPEDITPELGDYFSKVGSVYGTAMPDSIYAPPPEYSNEKQDNPAANPNANPEGPIDAKLKDRLAGGIGGAYALGAAPATAVGGVKGLAWLRAAVALKKLTDAQKASTAGAEPATSNVSTVEEANGPTRWVNRATTEGTRVPSSFMENVTTLKGHGPTSASAAEAANAAAVEKAMGIGEGPSKWRPTEGGTILLDTSPQTVGPRAETTVPLRAQADPNAPIGSQVGRGTVGGKNPTPAPTYADRFRAAQQRVGTTTNSVLDKLSPKGGPLTHPLVRLGAAGFGLGAMAPDFIEDVRTTKDLGEATPKLATHAAEGLGMGLLPTVLPKAVQTGITKVAPPLAALSGGYDAYKRYGVDPTGAAISGAGGLAALAPLVLGGPAGWTIAAGLGLGAPLVNYLRDTYGNTGYR